MTWRAETERTSFVAALLKDGTTAILMFPHVVSVLPNTNEVLTSCGVVYELKPESMDSLLSVWFGLVRKEPA